MSAEPITNSAAASTHQFGASATTGSVHADSRLQTTAVRPLPNRAMSGPASIPVSSAPSGMAAMAVPRAALDSSRWLLIAGSHGTTEG